MVCHGVAWSEVIEQVDPPLLYITLIVVSRRLGLCCSCEEFDGFSLVVTRCIILLVQCLIVSALILLVCVSFSFAKLVHYVVEFLHRERIHLCLDVTRTY